MPEINTKIELLEATERDYCALEGVLKGVDATFASQPCCGDGDSIKDVLRKQAQSIGTVVRWLVDAGPRDPAPLVAEPVCWPVGHRSCEKAQGDLDWYAVRALLANRHAKLVHVLAEMGEDELYGRALPGRSDWTVGQYAEATGAGHYRLAMTYARNCLKSGQSPGGGAMSC